jgi:hypothetical protein
MPPLRRLADAARRGYSRCPVGASHSSLAIEAALVAANRARIILLSAAPCVETVRRIEPAPLVGASKGGAEPSCGQSICPTRVYWGRSLCPIFDFRRKEMACFGQTRNCRPSWKPRQPALNAVKQCTSGRLKTSNFLRERKTCIMNVRNVASREHI